MYFCFVKEEIGVLSPDDPLAIQAQYAIFLGIYCCCDLSHQRILDCNDNPFLIAGKQVFLRTTCDNVATASSLIAKFGGLLLESNDEVNQIEHWFRLSLTDRTFTEVSGGQLLNLMGDSSLITYLKANPTVFLKTVKKGVSAKIPSAKILSQDKMVCQFLESYSNTPLILTEALELKYDCLGTKEARFFVFRGEIANGSRYLHSLAHTVPKSLWTAAKAMVNRITLHVDFPQNYVLDMGLFIKDNTTFADIIEINPISSSLCYINNSIFINSPIAFEAPEFMGVGAEFLYDAKMNPGRYKKLSYSAPQNAYLSQAQIDFT